jgi:hypothetical protein
MSSTKTVQQEIDRLYLESKMNRYIVSNEASLYYDLCSVIDKTITLDEFYKLFPYHNPDINSDYWKQQHNRWKEIWKQDAV